jgi:hypothetical protein
MEAGNRAEPDEVATEEAASEEPGSDRKTDSGSVDPESPGYGTEADEIPDVDEDGTW